MDDHPLILRARAGDEDACTDLIRHHQEAVFRLAYLILADADDAEDVAQETFIRALDALDRFDPERPLRPWLLRIAANLARNRRRTVGRYWGQLRRFWNSDPAETPDAEGIAVKNSENASLLAALRYLSEIDQEIIYLRYFMELSIQETADALNIEQGTVKSRLSRALERLRKIVERDFPLLREGRRA